MMLILNTMVSEYTGMFGIPSEMQLAVLYGLCTWHFSFWREPDNPCSALVLLTTTWLETHQVHFVASSVIEQ